MSINDDLTVYYDTDDFAIAATYNAAAVNGIFNHAYVEVEGVEGERPVFECAEADVAGIAHGETFTVNATTYTVVGVQPDGTGVVLIILSE